MKNNFLLLLTAFVLLLHNPVNAQQNILEEGEDKIKFFNAQQKFYSGDYTGALKLYKDLQSGRPNDAVVLFRLGECYLAMEDYTSAIEHLEKAKKQDPNAHAEIPYKLGRAYQLNGQIDMALEEYNAFRSTVTSSKKARELQIDTYILQCKTAKELMNNPLPVNIGNLGISINSLYDDKAPSISADGSSLVFNSRRPGGKSSNIDVEGDRKYFEDIYISKWDSAKGTWGDPEVLPGNVNTEAHDAASSISPDGKQLFVYKNNDKDAVGGDIFVSKLSSTGKWSAPKPLGKPISTSYFEDGACLSADGKTLYFVSERPDGLGRGDIYMSKKVTKKEWGKPVNLGPTINTEEDEGGLFIAPDGKTLFFSSEGHNSMGSYDIFRTTYEDKKGWSKPVNVGYPINSLGRDVNLVLTTDLKTAYFASDRKGGIGGRDLYKVDLLNYDILKGKAKETTAGAGMSILRGTVLSSEENTALEANIEFYDEQGNKTGSTVSNTEGEYFMTLTGDKQYEVKIELRGYEPVNEKLSLPASKEGTHTMVKHFVLNKKK